ncbi:glycosyltransferase [Phycicoccus sp. CSK15P-2]|uniref:glycosyltransferase family 2 protein n=1 Tax=Phycicoccus sp. CSK15P-2 TaxID=2807627 RepID=UPI0019513135|nr:glycosyltransferase family 2 protein [Phycicoccus sp. CSK15P-2]MBM6405290.1 glycosyltransferase [Phycicoccus sp. CSK15P-2]
MRAPLTRVLGTLTVLLGTIYVGWRWTLSVYWEHWWIAVPLALAETYALVDGYLFTLTVWRMKQRGRAPEPDPETTVDVFITTYNEPVEMVVETARAAKAITYPHETWVLDDGDRPEMAAAAAELGVGYVTRNPDWRDKPRHAKAGNLNNALFVTEGELILILDADQVPDPAILERTVGWFRDPEVALVQTPQWFTNVTDSDPLGSQAPLFYGPIQQGKDGWNAAFFCGSNAVLRRDALMQLGIVGYVEEVEVAVADALRAADRILARAARDAAREAPRAADALRSLRGAAEEARGRLASGAAVGEVTYAFQGAVDAASREVVDDDLAAIRRDLEAVASLPMHVDGKAGELVLDDLALDRLSDRDWSPLGAVESVRDLVRAVDVDRPDEAMPVMPMATISVTEDMATCMRLHSLGWRSVYHHEVLAHGLAPEDLGTMLGQRLRWAQGTLQVLLRENPLTRRGLTVGQRLMYFATMWSYLSGFAAVVFLVAPVVYLCFGVLPVHAYGLTFVILFTPYVVVNQLLFYVVGYGVKTWRGHQYSLALFPLWIRACVTAGANVFLRRPLGFVVTPKTRTEGGGFPVRLVLPQLVATVVLVVASVVGVVRLWTGAADSVIGTGVNLVWVLYDIVVISVIFQAALYRAPTPEKESTA